MTITLAPEVKKQLIASIRRFFEEKLEQDIGDLKAQLVLDYALREIAPTVYNQAIADAQAYFTQRTADLEGSCYEKEFTYWAERPTRSRWPGNSRAVQSGFWRASATLLRCVQSRGHSPALPGTAARRAPGLRREIRASESDSAGGVRLAPIRRRFRSALRARLSGRLGGIPGGRSIVTPREPNAREKKAPDANRKYEAPEVQASYEKEELEALIKPEGQGASGGCGCGSVL